ncbi:hypothetical protein [Clostridium sp. B9]|uniref:hypothetical protein n=1 Tax=Clostridium sp. B9 TaxID=3423224 RepID=UPI003D2F3C32
MGIIISSSLIDDLLGQIKKLNDEIDKLKGNKYFKNLINEAKKYIIANKYDEAERVLKKALIINSSCAEIENLLGILEEKRGNIILAQRYYRASLAFDPSYIPADNNLKRTVLYNRGETKVDFG